MFNIHHLAADHPIGSSGFGKLLNRPQLPLGGKFQNGPGSGFKSIGQQAVPSQEGNCFPIGDMAGGFPPPQVVVVHTRQVIVDQGIGVDHLQCRSKGERCLRLSAAEAAKLQHQYSPKPLPIPPAGCTA